MSTLFRMVSIRFSKNFVFWAIRVGDVYLILIEFDKNSQDINKENVTYKTDNLQHAHAPECKHEWLGK